MLNFAKVVGTAALSAPGVLGPIRTVRGQVRARMKESLAEIKLYFVCGGKKSTQ